jgi:chorismate dehydratase
MFTVGSVPYTNARPLVHSLEDDVQVDFAVPSALPALLESDQTQAIMVSSYDALSIPGRCFAEGCSISSLGAAQSVRLFSKVAVPQIQSLALDSSSLTSNSLARIVLAEKFGVRPSAAPCAPDLGAMLSGHDACLLIGDKGMTAHGEGLHVLDLGSAWAEMTGLPFVWALWVGKGAIAPELVQALNEARAWGQSHLEEVAQEAQARNGWPMPLVRQYLSETMNYDLGERHLEGLALFRKLLMQHGLMDEIPFPSTARASAPVA